MYRGRLSWKCPWNRALQLDLGEGPIRIVGPMSQPRGTIDTASLMLDHTHAFNKGCLDNSTMTTLERESPLPVLTELMRCVDFSDHTRTGISKLISHCAKPVLFSQLHEEGKRGLKNEINSKRDLVLIYAGLFLFSYYLSSHVPSNEFLSFKKLARERLLKK